MRNAYRSITEHADQLNQLLDELGDSLEIRLAKARVDEAVMWADRHIATIEHRKETQETIGRMFVDLFDRIAAAITAAKQGGTTDNPTYDQHLTALDQELSDLKGVEAGDAEHIAEIQTGLGKVADAVAPEPAPTPASDSAAPAAAAQSTAPVAAAGTAQAAAPTPAADQSATPTNTGSVDTAPAADQTAAPSDGAAAPTSTTPQA